MNSEITGAALLFVVLFLMMFWLGFVCGKSSLKSEAVQSGHAYWQVVDDGGKTEFKWKDIK